jgi:hypothetical protein
LTLSAQAQTPAPAPNPPARPTTSAVSAQTLTNITLVACLYREESVPGRTPNAAEKAGVLEDYILADASMPADATKNTTLATGNMYKVENIPDEKLRSLVGKRVEVSGKIDQFARVRGGLDQGDHRLVPHETGAPQVVQTSRAFIWQSLVPTAGRPCHIVGRRWRVRCQRRSDRRRTVRTKAKRTRRAVAVDERSQSLA